MKKIDYGFKNQLELFNYCWNTRLHISELSGEPLLPKGHPKWHYQFLHVLPKGSNPLYKLNPDNIMMALPDEHTNQKKYKKFRDKESQLRKEYYQKFYNKTYA